MKRSRFITALACVAAQFAFSGCGEQTRDDLSTSPDDGLERLLELGPAMVESAPVRRKVLEESLVDRTNGYSQLRLNKYGLGDQGWDALPERNFEIRSTTLDDIGAFVYEPFRLSDGEFSPVFDRTEFEWTDEHLRELGERVFHRYPLSTDRTLASAFESNETADDLGLWRTDDGRLGGFVRARLPDGRETFASTCASCHASVVDGALIDGRTNSAIDRGAMIRRFHGGSGSEWGPGRVDVTPDGETNPTAITDLRPIRHQNRLHWAATLYNSPEALAVRVETLMVTSARESMRPPREVAIAVAYYLWSLGDDVSQPNESSRGAALFERNCSTCHNADGTTQQPLDLEAIGTDPLVGLSPMRGTGQYRIPSLYRVGDRSQFLHHGEVDSLEELFSPQRTTEVAGHPYGTDLSSEDRKALIDYLETL